MAWGLKMGYIKVVRSKMYPNQDTKVLLNKTMGCCRFVYNNLLAQINEDYDLWKENPSLPKPKVSSYDLVKAVVNLKKEYEWLNEVSSVALQQSAMQLATAFNNFFKNPNTHKHPRFKSKRSNNGFRIVGLTSITIKSNKVGIPNNNRTLTTCRPSLPVRSDVSSYSVVRDRVGNYFINCTVTVPLLPNRSEQISSSVGIDLGIKSLATVVQKHNNVVKSYALDNPRVYVRKQKQRTRLSRRFAKKQLGGSNRNKARTRLAKLELKIANQRKDLLHKFTTKLINENQVIGIEDLNVTGLLRNHKLAKHIQDCGWGMIKEQLLYKSVKFKTPVTITMVDRFYPSTQTCSVCGNKRKVNLTLRERSWKCDHCGTEHDRDLNAAMNILMEAKRLTV